LCAELCGQGHPLMHGVVVVDTEQDYLAWLGQQQTFAQLSVPQQSGSANQPSGKAMASGLDVAANSKLLRPAQ
jgi:cytochrome c oxidase subunit 2